MTAFIHPANFHQLPVVQQVLERFALTGYARLSLLLEQLADAAESFVEDADSQVGATWEQWGELLYAPEPEQVLGEFFEALAEVGLVKLAVRDGWATVTSNAVAWTRPGLSPELYTSAEQWGAWFEREMSCPPRYAHSEGYQQFYRRWIASNVTTAEMAEAVNRAIAAAAGVEPAALQRHLSVIRKEKIEGAR